MKYWVFTIGVHNESPPAEWWVFWQHHRTEMWFPKNKRPVSIGAGDRALIYGSQAKGFIAAVEVTGHQPEDNQDETGRERYPWVMRHQLLVAKLADGHVASPEAAGIPSRKIQRGPHSQISAEDYERGVVALLDAARGTALG